jgi:hypothetical protein
LYFAEVEANVSNKGKNWTAAEDEVLKQRILRGASLREISRELDRTERSVRSRASTLRFELPQRLFGVLIRRSNADAAYDAGPDRTKGVSNLRRLAGCWPEFETTT